MNCDWCKIFENGTFNVEENRFGEHIMHESHICTSCETWLRKMISIRSRFLNEYHKSLTGVENY